MERTEQLFDTVGGRAVTATQYCPAAIADVLSLLDCAERVGLRSGRAMRLRAKLERGAIIEPERIDAIEQWLRDWLAHSEATPVFRRRTSPVTT